jgi:hypothetical protein
MGEWPEIFERVVRLRRGVVEVEQFKTIGDDRFVVVRPCGWDGESEWIPRQALEENLRPLVSRDVAEGWLQLLLHGTFSGDRDRAQLAVDFGTPQQQVEALAGLYSRRDADDETVIAMLERLVLVEISTVLEMPLADVRSIVRDHASATPIDDSPAIEPLPGTSVFGSFTVGGALHVRESHRGIALDVPAVSGIWDVFESGEGYGTTEDALLAIARSHRSHPREPASERVLGVISQNVAILDGQAQHDQLVMEQFYACASTLLGRHGVAWYWQQRKQIRGWFERELCFALEIRALPYDDET